MEFLEVYKYYKIVRPYLLHLERKSNIRILKQTRIMEILEFTVCL